MMPQTASLYIVALSVLILGICVVVMTTQISVPPSYAKVGPTIFPYAIGGALILLGALLFSDAFRHRWDCEAIDPQTPTPDLPPLLWIIAALGLNVLLIEFIGFILSSTLMFVLVARGFGAKRLLLTAAVGFVLSLLAYYGFAQVLGLRMGDGIIEDLI